MDKNCYCIRKNILITEITFSKCRDCAILLSTTNKNHSGVEDCETVKIAVIDSPKMRFLVQTYKQKLRVKKLERILNES